MSLTRSRGVLLAMAMAATAAGGCTSGDDLTRRAYVVSEEHEELTVIDLDRLEVIARVATTGVGNHMAELNADFSRAYVTSPETNEVIVVDVESFAVTTKIKVGAHPTHLTLSPDGRLLAVMAEDDDAVVFIDPARNQVVKTVTGFFTPHFMRYARDGRYAYVANAGAHHLSRVDLQALAIDEQIPLEGMPVGTPAPEEGGFADAQIAHDGVLYAANKATGRVLMYDTVARKKLPEIRVGQRPWMVYAEHPFPGLPLRHLSTNFGDKTVSLIDGKARMTMHALEGDSEAYGVNFSSRAPDKAFVMNRIREDIAVVDTARGELTARIPVGGNTETASTTPDGKWIVATVSSAASVVVIDAVTNAVVERFEGVGRYPWSVTIPKGQNYCH
jgi:YVTN family beta-propeller protein